MTWTRQKHRQKLLILDVLIRSSGAWHTRERASLQWQCKLIRIMEIGLLSLSVPTDSVQLSQWGNCALSSAQAVSTILCMLFPNVKY